MGKLFKLFVVLGFLWMGRNVQLNHGATGGTGTGEVIRFEGLPGSEDEGNSITLDGDTLTLVGKSDVLKRSVHEIKKLNTFGSKFLIRFNDGASMEFTITVPLIARKFEDAIKRRI